MGTQLYSDINPGAPSSAPNNLIYFDGRVFFGADAGNGLGEELYAASGGVSLARDINPGPGSSSPHNMAVVGNYLFFAATDSQNRTTLWSLSAGPNYVLTEYVINSGGNTDSGVNFITDVNGVPFFVADDGTTGLELWTVDVPGSGNARLVRDINPGPMGSGPTNLVRFANGPLFFSADDGGVAIAGQAAGVGRELWKSNGTFAGTTHFKDLNPFGNSSPDYLRVINNTLYFQANGGLGNGWELWTSDGTVAGTNELKDINVGAANSFPREFTLYNGLVYFSAQVGAATRTLWRTDGTANGTVAAPGAAGTFPESLIVCNNRLFFRGDTPNNLGTELGVYDG